LKDALGLLFLQSERIQLGLAADHSQSPASSSAPIIVSAVEAVTDSIVAETLFALLGGWAGAPARIAAVGQIGLRPVADSRQKW
jgi:hypothetical protein